jgi:chromosome segregation ATPase
MKSMTRNTLMLLISGSLLFSSCTNKEKEEAALQQVTLISSSKDSLENEMVRTMDEINKNLDLIRDKQGMVAHSSPGESLTKKEEILHNISLINALLEDNKFKIEQLNKQAKRLGKENSAMVKVAKQTKERIEKQEQEISMLKEQLAQAEFKIADLNVKLDEAQMANEVLTSERNLLSETNAKLDKDLNKAYFIYGTYKELKEKNIVEKKGGFLGVGKKEALASAFTKNRSSFTELDVREAKSIPIQGRKPKLVTHHPEGSYTWTEGENDYATLNITKPEDFWSTSKFLVIEIK